MKSALDVSTQYVESRGRRLAYRRIGEGPPLVMCLRFRGVLDAWDPAFLDALARSFSVYTFDYSGFGASTGTPSYERRALARDAVDLVDALGLGCVVIGGWSIGGIAAQIVAADHPERVSHAVLIGTGPPGPQPHPAEPVFLATALKPENDLEDETILFFEPASADSRAAARASHERIAARRGERSAPIPPETFLRALQEAHDPKAAFPDDRGYAQRLSTTSIPLLVVHGDHDIVFPVENWHALSRKWRSLYVATLPHAGHGPQHQEPELCARWIAEFAATTRAAAIP